MTLLQILKIIYLAASLTTEIIRLFDHFRPLP